MQRESCVSYQQIREATTGLYPGEWTLIPAHRWGSETIDIMAKKNYPQNFKRQAVDLYEHTEGATPRGIAARIRRSQDPGQGSDRAYGVPRVTAALNDGAPAAFPDEHECRRAVFRWVNRYNTIRRHSYCGSVAPDVYETAMLKTVT